MSAIGNPENGRKSSVVAILDIDGTLLDSSPIHTKAANKAFAALDIQMDQRPLEAYKNFTDWGVLDELMLEKLGCSATKAQLARFERALLDSFMEQISGGQLEEIKGASRFVSALSSEGTVLPVFATGSSRGAAEIKLRAIGVDPGKVILKTGSEYISREAIIRSALLAATEHLGHSDISTISIGDGLWDERTALGLNIPFIGVGGDASRFKLAVVRAIRDLTELTVDHVVEAARPFRL